MAELRGPSVAEELLDPLAGSKLMVSAATAIVMLPPGLATRPGAVVVVLAWTFSRLVWALGLAMVVADAPDFFVVLVVDPALAVVDVAPAAVVDVDPSPGGAVVVSPGAVVVVSSAAVVAVVDFLPPPPHAAATNAKETTATPTRAHECRPR